MPPAPARKFRVLESMIVILMVQDYFFEACSRMIGLPGGTAKAVLGSGPTRRDRLIKLAHTIVFFPCIVNDFSLYISCHAAASWQYVSASAAQREGGIRNRINKRKIRQKLVRLIVDIML